MRLSHKEKNNEILPFHKKYQKEIVLLLISITLSAIISFALFYTQFSLTKESEKKVIANGYLSDIESVNTSLFNFKNDYSTPTLSGELPMSKWIPPLYPEWGLYYSNRQEISKLDPELSKELYDFYNLLLMAELSKDEFNNFDSRHPKGEFQSTEEYLQNTHEIKMKIFTTMINLVNECYDYRIPYLRARLTKVINS